MKRILTTNEFPQWFNLDNYEKFNNLSTMELNRELDFRRNMQLHFPLNKIPNPPQKLVSQKSLKLIEDGKPKLTDYDWKQFHLARAKAVKNGEGLYISKTQVESSKKDPNELKAQLSDLQEFWLNRDLIISPIRIRDLLLTASHINSLLNEASLLKMYDETIIEHFLNLPTTSVLKSHELSKSKKDYEEELILSVNLAHASNEEILNEFKAQISGWRKILNIPEPLRVKSRGGDVNKIIKYKLFPLIDINLWAQENCIEIKPSVFMVKVFPLGEYGSKEFADYISEFMIKILDKSYPLFGKS